MAGEMSLLTKAQAEALAAIREGFERHADRAPNVVLRAYDWRGARFGRAGGVQYADLSKSYGALGLNLDWPEAHGKRVPTTTIAALIKKGALRIAYDDEQRARIEVATP